MRLSVLRYLLEKEYNAGVDVGQKAFAEYREADVAELRAKLEAAEKERDRFRLLWNASDDDRAHAVVERDEARAELALCATGPWIPGKPKVMDGRAVLASVRGNIFFVYAKEEACVGIDHHAEIRTVKEES